MDLRAKLLAESTEEGFKQLLRQQAKEMAADQKRHDMRKFSYVGGGKADLEIEETSFVSSVLYFFLTFCYQHIWIFYTHLHTFKLVIEPLSTDDRSGSSTHRLIIVSAKRGYYGFIIVVVRARVRRDFLLATYSPHFFPDFFHIWQVA